MTIIFYFFGFIYILLNVYWQVLCFGLGLPLTEHETVNDCAKIYLEWLSALTVPSLCVPKPVIDDPNPFAQVMLQHLLNLFKSRQDSGNFCIFL